MLYRALKDVQHGFYIDVGAQDPEVDSVTRAFYDRGWHGINIEPVQHWFEKLERDRPHDINLRVAVSDHEGELTLYESDASGLSTSDSAFADDARSRGWVLRENRVPCITLEQICTENRISAVHFLKVDCEGAEEQALRGMPLEKVRPWIILVEATEPNSTRPTHQQWEHLLTKSGYQFIYFDGLNRYYLAAEHPELRDSFAVPPHVFDWFKRAEEDRAHKRVQELHRELQEARSVERATRAEIERDHWLRENERREAALGQARTLIANLQEQSASLSAEIERLRGDVVQLGEQRARDCERFQVEVNRHIERANAQESEIARLQPELAQLGHERGALKLEIERLQQEYRANAIERDHLHARLATLLASRSWRFTRPLRLAGRVARATGGTVKRRIKAILRPAALRVRPGLRWFAHRPKLRAVALMLMGGRHSAVSRRVRAFLFGARPVEAPHQIALIGSELDPSVYSKRERRALAELQRVMPHPAERKEN